MGWIAAFTPVTVRVYLQSVKLPWITLLPFKKQPERLIPELTSVHLLPSRVCFLQGSPFRLQAPLA